MKPTSVIFMIVSILLACLGILLCMTASNMATQEGISIFSQVGGEDDNFVTTEELDTSELKKIVLKVEDVDVNVYGGAEASKVELVNFSNGSYTYQLNRSTLQISDNAGISGIIDIDNLKINFNGFRDYIYYFEYKDKAKSVNVYLADDVDLVNFVITTSGGDINLSELELDCDYKITTSSGHVSLSNVTTTSSVQIESTESSNIDIVNVDANEYRVLAFEAFLNISESTFSRAMYVNVETGDIVYDRVESDFSGLDVALQSISGSITVFNNQYTEIYSELNAPKDEPALPPATDEPADEPTDEPADDENVSDGEELEGDDTAVGEADSDVEPDEEGEDDINQSLVVPANTLTIIIAEGNIEVK